MIKKLVFLMLFAITITSVDAQQLLTPSFTYSHKKPSFITLTDGKVIKGIIDDVDRKKGLIEEVKIVDSLGTKHKLKAESIQYMYLPPSGYDNLTKAMDFMSDAQKWNDEKLDQDLLNQGYAYFENAKVQIKKTEMVLLMQLLNPSFSKKVKVYHDPLADETMSVGVGGVAVAGGDAKSYFIKVDDKTAYKLEKKEYKKEFPILWKDCDKVITTYTEIKWSELTKHIVDFSECAQ